MNEKHPVYVAHNNSYCFISLRDNDELFLGDDYGRGANMIFDRVNARRLALTILDLLDEPVIPEPPNQDDKPFRRARKRGGSFQHAGTLVAEFRTTAGENRVVLEFDAPVQGLLHVYRPDQVEIIQSPPVPAESGDKIVDAVRARLLNRSLVGQQKYGEKMTRDDLTILDWIRHAQEEALDTAVYLERFGQDWENMISDGR